jgi:NAD(P)-dependent dehydrogenase (short-subunit alcohol dehydrogenase family)
MCPDPDAITLTWRHALVIDPGLRGRVALVTGANQGIGAAAARALAARGAAVFVTALRLGPEDPGVRAMNCRAQQLHPRGGGQDR